MNNEDINKSIRELEDKVQKINGDYKGRIKAQEAKQLLEKIEKLKEEQSIGV